MQSAPIGVLDSGMEMCIRDRVVTARSADGEIEAVEMPGERFFVGVQWHPEKSLKDDALSANIFKALRAAMR